MKIKDYSNLALRTAKSMPTAHQNIWHATAGLVTETGEIFDAYKKHMIYGKPLDTVNVLEEVGDLMWYLNLYAYHKGCLRSFIKDPSSYNLGQDVEVEALLASLLSGVNCAYHRESEVQGGPDYSTTAKIIVFITTIAYELCQRLGSNLADCLDTNIKKLACRYGDKYSDYSALNRDVSKEREILDGSIT